MVSSKKLRGKQRRAAKSAAGNNYNNSITNMSAVSAAAG